MLAALKHRDFRLLWLGQSVSVIGDGLIMVAVGLYLTRLTGNPSDVGVVLMAYAIPLVAFVLIGGVIADRLPRQAVMIASDLIRAVLHGTLAVLIATGAVRIWHMVVIGLLFGSAEAFFRPAYSGLVPQTVPESEIQQAQALGGFTREIATFASPALATALVLGVGGAAAFGLDALTFLVSAAFLLRVRARSRGETMPRTTIARELTEGWHAVRCRPWVWATIAAFSIALLVALAPFFVLGASVAEDVYGSSAVYGLANAAWGIGTMSGALAGSKWRPRHPMRAAMLAGMWWPGTMALFAAGPPLAVLYAGMAAAGLGIGLFAVWWETALAERIPPHLLSRVTAWDWMGSLALLPIGYLVTGRIGEAVGETRLLFLGGLAGLAVMALGLLPRSTRRLSRIERVELPEPREPALPLPLGTG